MSKAPEICLYCKGTGYSYRTPCGFCVNGKPLDTQEDWDNSWGKLFEDLGIPTRKESMNWHQDVIDHEEDYLIEAQNDDFGMPVPVIMEKIINKYAPKDDIIEGKKRFGRCEICGTRTGQHSFSFSKAQY